MPGELNPPIDHACTDCGVPVASDQHGVRYVGRDGFGRIVELCSRCYLKRDEDSRPMSPIRRRA